MFNILKNILIIYLLLKIIKVNKFKNLKENLKLKKKLINLKNKKKKIKEIYKSKKIYFGYILCSKKCPKILKKIKIKNNGKFIFLSINNKENSYILEKNLSKIKKKKNSSIFLNKKNIEKFSKIFKIIYKYKIKKINHNQILYKINIKKRKYINFIKY